MKNRTGLLALAALALFSVVPAHATFILQFDEAGHGMVNQNSGGFLADNGFVVANDPTSTLHNVLVYLLPEPVSEGDVVINDVTGGPSDLLRFTHNSDGVSVWMIFYSADTSGGLLADTGLPSNAGTFVGATEDLTNHFDYNTGTNDYQGFSGNAIPEPASMTLMGLGLAGVGLLARKLRK